MGKSIAKRVDRSNFLPADIAGKLVQFLREQDAQPGFRLTERAIAKQFDVSRSPVRAALKILADAGVAETRSDGRRYLRMNQKQLRKYEKAAPANPLGELYDRLITDQISGKLPEQFTEAYLLRHLDAPRGLILKALANMAKDGLIERRKGHGWRCLPTINSMESNAKSYEFRLALEPTLLLSDDFDVDEARLNSVYSLQKEMSEGRISRMTTSEIFQANAEVHLMLAEFSGNSFFIESIRKQNQLRLILENRAAKHYDRMAESCLEHLAILDAVANGKRTSASKLMTMHLTRASQTAFGLAK